MAPRWGQSVGMLGSGSKHQIPLDWTLFGWKLAQIPNLTILSLDGICGSSCA